MAKFKVGDRVKLNRVLDIRKSGGMMVQFDAPGTVAEISDTGYTVVFDDKSTFRGLEDRNLALLEETHKET